MYVLSVIYASFQLIIIETFNILSYDEGCFDANDLTRSYFSFVSIVSLAIGCIVSGKISLHKHIILLYISLSSVVIFYIASLFSNGLMLR